MTATPEPAGTPAEPDAPQPARGVRQLTSEEFSLAESVGGVRGVVETLLPGVVFVVVYVATRELTPTLVAALGVALLAVVVRLVQRTPVTQAFSGVLGVAIGVFWAWRSGDASNFFLLGIITNAVYLPVCLVSVLVRWPVVGVVVELLRAGLGTGTAASAPAGANPLAGWTAWRADRALVRRYALATWCWVALFAVRLAVQVPLYLDASAGWLGVARLVMGVPLWALTLWATWILVRRSGAPREPGGPLPAP